MADSQPSVFRLPAALSLSRPCFRAMSSASVGLSSGSVLVVGDASALAATERRRLRLLQVREQERELSAKRVRAHQRKQQLKEEEDRRRRAVRPALEEERVGERGKEKRARGMGKNCNGLGQLVLSLLTFLLPLCH